MTETYEIEENDVLKVTRTFEEISKIKKSDLEAEKIRLQDKITDIDLKLAEFTK